MAACVSLACLTAWLFHPGMLSRDSVEQLAQAVSGEFTDWHPPLMAAVWAMLLRLPGLSKAGAAPLLFDLHLAAYWGAWALVARAIARRTTRPWAPWLAPAMALTPACLTFTVNVWKDVGLAVAWLLAVMLQVEARETRLRPARRRMYAAVSLLLLLYGLGVRRNALFGLPPLALLWWTTFVPRSRRLIGAAFLCVLLVFTSAVLERFVLRPAPARQAQLFLLAELTAMRCADGGDETVVFPEASWRGNADVERLCRVTWARIVRHHNADHTIYGDEAPFVVAPDDGVTVELLRSLRDAVVHHPLRWAAHRLHMLGGLLDGGVVVRFHGVRENVLGLRFSPSVGTAAVSSYVAAFERSGLFSAWFWGLLAAAGLWLTRSRPFGVAQAAFASGLCYFAGYLLVAVAPDSRYLYWTVLATSAGWLAGPVRARLAGLR